MSVSPSPVPVPADLPVAASAASAGKRPTLGFKARDSLVVFVHNPKCAGTSLRLTLEARLGRSRVQLDYGSPALRARAREFLRRMAFGWAAKQLVYGHFPIERYCLEGGVRVPGYFYAAYFRHPLQRAISHYHYFKRTQHGGDWLWKEMHAGDWSLERFVLEPRLAEMQCWLMGRFDVETLDFAGLAERYEDGLKLLGRLNPALAGLSEVKTNTNPEKAVREGYQVDAELAAKHRALNPKDYALYEGAVRRFEGLWKTAGF